MKSAKQTPGVAIMPQVRNSQQKAARNAGGFLLN
jgi:hypothetical protein